GDFSICRTHGPRCTVLSWFTVRSCCNEKIRSRFFPRTGRKACPGCAPATGKALVELPEVRLAQELVGRSHASYAMNPQFLRQAPLPRAKVTFSSSPRLRRLGRNHLNPHFRERPPTLGRVCAVDRLACFRRVKEMGRAIAVQ